MTLISISLNFQRISRDFADFGPTNGLTMNQYCQRQRCTGKHVELEQFWHAFASRGFVSDAGLSCLDLQVENRASGAVGTIIAMCQLYA